MLTTVKWASGSGRPFLGEDRNHSGVNPTAEVKKLESQDGDVGDLEPNDEEKPNQPNAKPNAPSEPVAPKIQPEDIQLKKALEILRDKPAQRGA